MSDQQLHKYPDMLTDLHHAQIPDCSGPAGAAEDLDAGPGERQSVHWRMAGDRPILDMLVPLLRSYRSTEGCFPAVTGPEAHKQDGGHTGHVQRKLDELRAHHS